MKIANIIKKIFFSFLGFIKNHKLLCLFFVVLVFALIVSSVVFSNIKEEKIKEQLEGKLFVSEWVDSKGNTQYNFHQFKNCRYSYENFVVRDNEKSRSGSLGYGDLEYCNSAKMKVKVRFFKKSIQIYTRSNDLLRCYGTYNFFTNSLILRDDDAELREITVDDYYRIYSLFFCEHENAKETIIKEASCTEDGKKTVICDFCGYQNEEIIPKGHKYDHHICEVCGNREKSSIRPNTWETDYSVNLLKYYNCEVEMPQISGASVLLVCYPVCQKCRYVSKFPLVKNVEYGMENTSIYTCPDCNEITVVKLACYE